MFADATSSSRGGCCNCCFSKQQRLLPLQPAATGAAAAVAAAAAASNSSSSKHSSRRSNGCGNSKGSWFAAATPCFWRVQSSPISPQVQNWNWFQGENGGNLLVAPCSDWIKVNWNEIKLLIEANRNSDFDGFLLTSPSFSRIWVIGIKLNSYWCSTREGELVDLSLQLNFKLVSWTGRWFWI